MAARVVRILSKSGTVPRGKVRAAARQMVKLGKVKHKKGAVTRTSTASGRQQIGFKEFRFKAAS